MASGRVPIIVRTFTKKYILNFEGRQLFIFSLTRRGCVEYASEMCRRLQDLEPYIVTSEESAFNFSVVDYKMSTYSGNLSFLSKTPSFYFRVRQLIRLIAESSSGATIYFPLYHPWNYLIAKFSKKYKLRVITTVHDFVTHVGDKSSMVERIQKKTIDLADHVVFLTEKERGVAININPTLEKKSLTVPHPILPTFAKNNLSYSSPLKFLLLGRIRKYKGIDLVLDAYDTDKNYTLTIAGDGQIESDVPDTIRLINRHLSVKEVAILLEEHHVLLLPYIDASQSGILTLGIDAEMPMIVSSLNGLKEQLPNDAALWIDPNAASLSKAMNTISSNPELYQNLKKKISEFRNTEELDFSEEVKKLISLLKP